MRSSRGIRRDIGRISAAAKSRVGGLGQVGLVGDPTYLTYPTYPPYLTYLTYLTYLECQHMRVLHDQPAA